MLQSLLKQIMDITLLSLMRFLPVPANENDVSFIAWLQTQIQNDGRLDAAKNNLQKNGLVLQALKKPYNEADLWLYTDSALKNSAKLPGFV